MLSDVPVNAIASLCHAGIGFTVKKKNKKTNSTLVLFNVFDCCSYSKKLPTWPSNGTTYWCSKHK